MRQSDNHKASPLLPTAQEYSAWHIPLVLATPSVASFRAPFFSTHLQQRYHVITIIITRTHMSSPVTRMPMSQCRGSLTSSSGLSSLL